MGYMQTQMDIIQSQRVARQVVTDLKLAENPTRAAPPAQKAGGHGHDRGLGGAGPARRSSRSTSRKARRDRHHLLGERLRSSPPHVANAFAKAYMDTTLNLRTEPTKQASAWFDEQLKGLRTDLENAQAKLAAVPAREGHHRRATSAWTSRTRASPSSRSQALQATSTELRQRRRAPASRQPRRRETLPEVIANPAGHRR